MTGTVALTGATGFDGGHVLRALLMAGWRVNALMRGPARLNAAPGLTVIEGDLADEQALARLIGGVDLIIHCAGVTKAATNAEFFRVNTAGTATGRFSGIQLRNATITSANGAIGLTATGGDTSTENFGI